MARTASTFANHQVFPAQGEVISAEGLTHTLAKVTASDIVRQADGKTVDENASRSGEMEVPVYTAESLEAALTLFGGSESELVKAAVNAFNQDTQDSAKRFIAAEIQGPEKIVEAALRRLAKQFDTTYEVLKAKCDTNPAYQEMLLNFAKS
jgi:hypothetical protein